MPSVWPGRKTCTNATSTLATPAATQPQQKAANRSCALQRARAPAPPANTTAAASSVAMADNAKLPGSEPGPQAHAAASTNTASAAHTGQGPRRGVAGTQAMTKPAHKAKARAWFKKVGDGLTLWASSDGRAAAKMAVAVAAAAAHERGRPNIKPEPRCRCTAPAPGRQSVASAAWPGPARSAGGRMGGGDAGATGPHRWHALPVPEVQ